MPKVMVIEDDPTMRSLLVSLLEIEGFRVVQADYHQSIDQVVEFILEEHPDVLLLDLKLGNLNGLDLLNRLHQFDSGKDIRVLISSGRDASHECIQAGADDFIMKPFMPDELIAKIHELSGKQ
jgi:DNA-binding response OmpR family regulator